MLTVDETVLYDEFLAAREKAIALTDRYHASTPTSSDRAELWDGVMRQTETARLLLERWLRSGKLTDLGRRS
ncbi:MAG: hypothetical protein JOZ65_10340 [Chloroflexi bacterium]|nr:hypothetical protein [Chloroflexota bacterium]